MAKNLSKEQRIQALNQIFTDFGIPVYPKSNLEQIIHNEFGPGKRSKITKLLSELEQDTDAAKLAICIGNELKQGTKDKHVLAVSSVLTERLPGLLDIVDVRNNTDKRAKLLSELLEHFRAKLPNTIETERLHRMLDAAYKNITLNLNAKIVGEVVENVGIFCSISELKRFGKLMNACIPALLALDQKDYPLEQKVNLTIQAFKTLSYVLQDSNMQQGASILENIFWLAKVALPHTNEKATVEQALYGLGISLGMSSTKLLIKKGMELGLTEREMVQIIYSTAPSKGLPETDLELMDSTLQNQRYAAICGLLAKLARDTKQPELEKVSIAGICLASMRQTYCELKTNNLHAVNFSESLGTILLGAGAITENNTLTHFGKSILTGVSTYTGVMAMPGGTMLAVPLAVCSVLGKLFLDSAEDSSLSQAEPIDGFNSIIHQILQLQLQMRYEFRNIQRLLSEQHNEMLQVLDHGFNNISNLIQSNNWQASITFRKHEEKLLRLENQISQEFSELYLQYVHDPLEEVDFFTRYGNSTVGRLDESQHKLSMWLLYKSKHPKVTGMNVALENHSALLAKFKLGDSSLSLINRYVNKKIGRNFDEDLPHIPTWLQAVQAYTILLSKKPQNIDEIKVVHDVLAIGRKMQKFVNCLAMDKQLWDSLQQEVWQSSSLLHARWHKLREQMSDDYLQAYNSTMTNKSLDEAIIAESAPSNMQFESFTPTTIDISHIWSEEIIRFIPQEFFAAVKHGLGLWQISFVIDKNSNTFTDLHIPCGTQILPNHARDVIFRIDVKFKPTFADAKLLTSTYVAYDLYSAQNRMDKYYRRKFRLRHTQYDWISRDGMENHVSGYANTATHKLINQDNLSIVFREWLSEASLISNSEVAARLADNPLFVQANADMLASMHATRVDEEQISKLQAQLSQKLTQLMQNKRLEYAHIMQEDKILNSCMQKIDLYTSILCVYLKLLNTTYPKANTMDTFKELVSRLQETENLDSDLVSEFDKLFQKIDLAIDVNNNYAESEFMQLMQGAITKLELLQANLQINRLRL